MTGLNINTSGFKPKVIQSGNFEKYVHYSDELENAIIGICLIENDKILEILQYIKNSDVFYFEDNKVIYEAMVRLVKDDRPVDLLTVVPEIVKYENNLHPGVNWSYECALRMRDVTSSAHLLHWCMLLVQFYIKREQINHALNIWAVDDVFEASKNLNEKINEAMAFNSIADWNSIEVVMLELMARREKIRKGHTFGIPTGFIELDEITGGGLETGFHVICARPAMGKTAFALSMAINIAEQGIGVGIISLEMPNVQLGSRIIAITSNIDFKRIFKGQSESDVNYNHTFELDVETKIKEVNGMPLYISDTTQVNIHAIRYKALKLVRDLKARVLFIDYLQLVDLEDKKGEQRYVAVGKLSRGLKILSKELDIPIIALAQLNRDSEGADKQSKPGRISQLRESGSIEQDMDMGIVIDRPYKRGVESDPTTNESTINDAYIDVQKHRNGEEKLIKINFNPSTMRFYDPNRNELPKLDSFKMPQTDRNTAPAIQSPNLEVPF